MKQFSPFILNSEIVTSKKDILNYDSIVKRVDQNPGNSYITYGLIKSLYGKLVKVNDFNYYQSTEEERYNKLDEINASSHVFLMMQDQIRPKRMEAPIDYNKLSEYIKKINKPVIVTNIGAEGYIGEKDVHKLLSKELVNFLHTLSEHSTYIGLRGAYTQDVLAKLGIKNTIITGCPTYFECGRNRIIKKRKNVTKEDIIYFVPFSLSNIKGHSILQGDSEVNVIRAIVDGGKYLNNENKYNPEILNAYLDKKYHFFTNIEDWKTFIKKFKVSAGMRIHGTIIAINSGLSPVMFIRDIRTQEMVEYFKLPYFYPEDTSKDILELYEKLDYSETNKIYNKLYDNWVDFLHKNDCLMYYENPQVENIEEFKQPKTVELYSNMIKKDDIIFDMVLLVNKKLNNLQKHLDIANQKISSMENKAIQRKERMEKIFSVKNSHDKSHKVVCVLGVKMKFKKHVKNNPSDGGGVIIPLQMNYKLSVAA